MITITITGHDGLEHIISAKEGDNLMDLLRQHEWGVAAICGGLCSCGTCHVYLDNQWLDTFQPRDPDEEDLLGDFDSTRDNSRLSCQLYLTARHDGLTLSIAPDE